MAFPPDPKVTAPPVVRNHRRFALTDVTLAGEAVGGATVDSWIADAGVACWSARLLMPPVAAATQAELAGTMRSGQRVRGLVQVAEVRAGPRNGRSVLVELLGVTPLREDPGPT